MLGGKPSAVAVLRGMPAGHLLILACLGIVVVHLGSGGLTLLHNYTTIGVGQKHGQRSARRALRASAAAVARLSRPPAGRRPALPHHRRQLCRADDDHERRAADPVGGGAARRHADHTVPARSDFDLAGADRRAGAVRADRRASTARSSMSRPRCATTESRVYSLVQWAMSSIKVVQAFTREDDEHRRFMGASRESLRATLRLYSWQTLYSGAVNGVIAAGTALVVYAGARAVLSGALTLGQLIVFISYLAQLYAPINQITQSWGLIAGARVGARRVFEVLDTEPDLDRRHAQLPAARCARRSRVARRRLSLSAGDAGAARDRSLGADRRQDRDRRPDRGRQIDPARPAAAVLRPDRGQRSRSTASICATIRSNRCAARSRWCCSRR